VGECLSKKRILINGAGLGGLALAQGLLRSGYNVRVFERDEGPKSRGQGYRISIRRLGRQALEALLTPEKLERIEYARVKKVGTGFTCANSMMESLYQVPLGEDPAVDFLRSELRKELAEGLDVEWGKKLVDIDDREEEVIAFFEDGSSTSGDLLIGCDGGHSSVRRILLRMYGEKLGSVPRINDSKRVVFAAQVDRTSEWEKLLSICKDGLVRFQGQNDFHMGICFSERADRTLTIYWGVGDESESRHELLGEFDPEKIKAYCKKMMQEGAWHETLVKLVDETPLDAFMKVWCPQTSTISKESKFPISPTGRVTLLGDAAHAMPSDSGLGGSQAFEDARLLSSLLIEGEDEFDLPKIIEKYEREMFWRAKTALQETKNASEYFRQLSGK